MCPLVNSHLSACLRMHAHTKTRPHFENSDVSLSHHLVSRKITDIYHHFDYDDSGGPCPVCVCKCVRVSMELNEVCTLLRGLGTWNKGVPYLLFSLSLSLSSSFVVALLCMSWRPFWVEFRFELRGVSCWTQVRSGEDSDRQTLVCHFHIHIQITVHIQIHSQTHRRWLCCIWCVSGKCLDGCMYVIGCMHVCNWQITDPKTQVRMWLLPFVVTKRSSHQIVGVCSEGGLLQTNTTFMEKSFEFRN
jgi:hypothetical protein